MSAESSSEKQSERRVALGVTGGIAAYKAAEILRGLQRAGCTVRVAMTRRACEFITPLTFRALSGSHVVVDDYAPDNPDPIAHITFSQTVDLLVVAPATADIIAKFANGIADDFLSTTYLAANCPVLIAPAMNTTMWQHPATRRNLERLRADGLHIIEPDAGEMACGTIGPGRLTSPEAIVSAALEILDLAAGASSTASSSSTAGASSVVGSSSTAAGASSAAGGASSTGHASSVALSSRRPLSSRDLLTDRESDLVGEHLLITAGATREEIDPVRFLSNHSSGRMGFALAEAARLRGAQVTVVAGVTSATEPDGVRLLRATSAGEMYRIVLGELERATVFVGAAAVADYKPANVAAAKIKKSDAHLTLTLEPTKDILAEVSRTRRTGQLVIGFAAETEDVLRHAGEKLRRKGLDAIVANDLTREGAGFDKETNIITILARDRDAPLELPLLSKLDAAQRILDEVVRLRRAGQTRLAATVSPRSQSCDNVEEKR